MVVVLQGMQTKHSRRQGLVNHRGRNLDRSGFARVWTAGWNYRRGAGEAGISLADRSATEIGDMTG
jgi:hypothetical protein